MRRLFGGRNPSPDCPPPALKRQPTAPIYEDFLGLQTLWPKDAPETDTSIELVMRGVR